MYPVLRMVHQMLRHRGDDRLGVFDTHVSRHRCWPHDIDIWMELNNGRTLTLYDLGRIVLIQRTGIAGQMRRNGWGATIAGASVRYRKRVRMFDEITMRSRILGWDHRFIYIEQGLWVRGDCASHVLFRVAMTDRNGLVPTSEAGRLMGVGESPALPAWVDAWIAAEADRPWPPMAE